MQYYIKRYEFIWFLFEYCTKHVWLYTFLQEEEGSKEKQSGVYYSNKGTLTNIVFKEYQYVFY